MGTRAQRRWASALLTVVALACLAYVVSTLPGVRPTPGHSRLWEVLVYNTVASGAALAVLLRAALVRAARAAWTVIGLGATSYALGTLYFSVHLQPMTVMPYPSLADGLWLGFYAAAVAGVLVLARHELRRRRLAGPRPATALDGLVAGLTLAALSAAFAFDRTTGGEGTLTEVLTNFAYPVADLVLIVLVASVLVVLGRTAGTAWWLLALGFLFFAAADTWFLLQISADTYAPGTPVDATWAVAETALALAAWRPPAAPVATNRSPLAAALLPTASGVGAVAVLVAGQVATVSLLGSVLAAAALVTVFVRLVQSLRQAVLLAESREQARTDELTGLPNRRAFFELADAVGRTPSRAFSLLLLDLDRFKEVNDALGHRTGDHLLRQVGTRLSDAVPAEHRVARLGGDEFAVLVDGPSTVAVTLAERLLAAMREPYDVGPMALHIDASIGVAELDPGTDPGRNLARADVAMYRAKSRRTAVHVYEDDTDGDGWDRLAMVEALRRGIAGGELELDFQPIVDARTGQPQALEALVRWQHPSRGRVPPDMFLPMAEQTGLMRDVTRVVLGLALDHARRLRRVGLHVPVSVNLSASDLLDASLADAVAHELQARRLDPTALHIEITETLLVVERSSDHVLDRLRGLGVRLSVDDYGTGYSSLAYLHDLPVAELKIDRTFTHRVLTDHRTAVIVRSTVALAHDLGLTLVGEGVETEEQRAWLELAGADSVQGFGTGRPMSGTASLEWLSERLDQVADLGVSRS